MGLLTDFKSTLKITARKLLATRHGWKGDYSSWAEAEKKCEGYDAANILEKVKNAMIKVRNGEAVFERDSVLFDTPEYAWPLLSLLMTLALEKKGSLSVLDFGGSLGTSFFQNKMFFDRIPQLDWNVIEQGNFVTVGKESFETNQLHFYYSAQEYIQQHGIPDVLVMSCVLPYIPEPYELLKNLTSLGIPNFIIDDTPFNYEERDRILVQIVPEAIYKASYPARLLSYEKVKAQVARNYKITSEHFNTNYLYVDGRTVKYRGFFAEMNK